MVSQRFLDMASQIQQNITISAGVPFTKQFTALNEDRSPKDLTGYIVSARMAKHNRAVNAVTTKVSDPVWKYINFTGVVVDPTAGTYSPYLPM